MQYILHQWRLASFMRLEDWKSSFNSSFNNNYNFYKDSTNGKVNLRY